jgi:hypothetical protein
LLYANLTALFKYFFLKTTGLPFLHGYMISMRNDHLYRDLNIPGTNTSRHNALRIRRISGANLRREGIGGCGRGLEADPTQGHSLPGDINIRLA